MTTNVLVERDRRIRAATSTDNPLLEEDLILALEALAEIVEIICAREYPPRREPSRPL